MEPEEANKDVIVPVESEAPVSNLSDISTGLEQQITSFDTPNPNVVKTDTDTINKVKKEIDNPDALNLDIDTYTADLDLRSEKLQQRMLEDQKFIDADFDKLEKSTGKQQENEFGGLQSKLVRMGGYLGPSASHTSAMISLNQEHRDEISQIKVERARLKSEARRAYEDGDFEIMKEKQRAYESAEEKMQNSRESYFNRQIKLNQEKRAAEENEFKYNQVQAQSDADGAILSGLEAGIDDLSLLRNLIPEEQRKFITTNDILAISEAYKKSKIDDKYQVTGTPSSGMYELQFSESGRFIRSKVLIPPPLEAAQTSELDSVITDPDKLKDLNRQTGLGLPFGATYRDFMNGQAEAEAEAAVAPEEDEEGNITNPSIIEDFGIQSIANEGARPLSNQEQINIINDDINSFINGDVSASKINRALAQEIATSGFEDSKDLREDIAGIFRNKYGI